MYQVNSKTISDKRSVLEASNATLDFIKRQLNNLTPQQQKAYLENLKNILTNALRED